MTMKPMTAVTILAACALIYIAFGITRGPSVTVHQRPAAVVEIGEQIDRLQAELDRRQNTIDSQRAELARQRQIIEALSAEKQLTPEAAKSPVHAAHSDVLEQMRQAIQAAKEQGQ